MISWSSGYQSPGNVVSILRERGLLESVTSEDLEAVALKQPLKVYCGFDPTADSLHLGNLLGIVVLSWFQRCGHSPIAVLGGATGRVGDPSGKSAERPVLSEEVIELNIKGHQEFHFLLSCFIDCWQYTEVFELFGSAKICTSFVHCLLLKGLKSGF